MDFVSTLTCMHKSLNMNSYDINDSFPILIAECEKHMRESLNARFRDAGYQVTVEQWIILIHLHHQDGISQQELANRCNRSKVSALNLIKKLKKDEYVIRKNDPNDGRLKRIFLTTKGDDLLQALIPIAKKNIKTMTRGISEEEITLLKKIVRKIIGNLPK